VPPCLSKLSRIIKLRHDCRKSPLLVLPLSLGSPAGELRARSTAKAQSAAGEEWRSFATVIEMSITGIAVRSRRTSEELLSRGTRTENQTSAIALPNSFHEIARYFRGAKPLGCPSSGSLCSSIVPRAGESTLRSLVLRAGSLSLSLSLSSSLNCHALNQRELVIERETRTWLRIRRNVSRFFPRRARRIEMKVK